MKAGWETKALGEVARVGAGNSAPQADVLFKDGDIPFFRTSDAGRIRFGDIFEATDYLNELGGKGLRRFPVGTILFPKSGASTFLNHRVMLGAEGCVSSHLATIIANEAVVDKRFLLFFLSTVESQDLIQDHAYPSLNLPVIASLSIPLPPLPEQHRIVAILDKAFEGIAKTKAAAVANLQNARAVFESHLQEVFTSAYRAGESVTLSDLATDITDGDHMPPPKASTGVPFITIGNVEKSTRTIDFSDTFMVARDYFDKLKPNKKPAKGDVLYTVTGSFGIPVLLTEQREFCFQRHIGLIRPKSSVNSEWLYYLLLSPQVLKQANDGATGTAQKTVSLKVLRGYQVPQIKLADQQVAVSKLKAMSAQTQHLESLYQRKIAALDELKKSLLHQAFSGAL
jgi:type I restriction enzyme, S subunit